MSVISRSTPWPRLLGGLLGLGLLVGASALIPGITGELSAQERANLDTMVAGALPTKTFALPSGMKVVLYQDLETDFVTAAFVHRAGVAREWQGLKGAAHVTAAMLTAGTSAIGTQNYAQERRILQEMDRLDKAMRDAAHTLATTSGDPDVEHDAHESLNEARTAFQESSEALASILRPDAWAKAYEDLGGEAPEVVVRSDGILYRVSVPPASMNGMLRLENRRLQDSVSHTFYSERDRLARTWEGEWNSGASYPLWETLSHTAFLSHPYGLYRGTSEHLQALSRGELDYFMDLFTDPSRTVLAIVGPQTIEDMEAMVRRSLSAPGRPLAGPLEGEELPQRGERRALVRVEGEAELLVAYHQKKPWDPRERAALALMADLLAHPKDGLLPVVLAASDQSPAQGKAGAKLFPEAGPLGPEDPAAFVFELKLTEPDQLCATEAALWGALATLAENGPPLGVFKAAQERVVAGLDTLEMEPAPLASALAWSTLTHGSPDALALHRRAVSELKPKDIQRAAMEIFDPNNRSVVIGWPTSLPGSLAACNPLGGAKP